jgi:predicted transcriptional regulator
MSTTLKIKFKALATSGSESPVRGKKRIMSADSTSVILYFPSTTTFQKFFSPQKIALLSITQQQKPKSIYELASLAKRTFPAVFNDVKSLVHHGFMVLVANNDARHSQQPQLAFNYEQIVVDNHIGPYRIDLALDYSSK